MPLSVICRIRHNSDRGSQYLSSAWREATEKKQRSYSHSGYPYDNACIESFHSLIKREWLNRFYIINYKHAFLTLHRRAHIPKYSTDMRIYSYIYVYICVNAALFPRIYCNKKKYMIIFRSQKILGKTRAI